MHCGHIYAYDCGDCSDGLPTDCKLGVYCNECHEKHEECSTCGDNCINENSCADDCTKCCKKYHKCVCCRNHYIGGDDPDGGYCTTTCSGVRCILGPRRCNSCCAHYGCK